MFLLLKHVKRLILDSHETSHSNKIKKDLVSVNDDSRFYYVLHIQVSLVLRRSSLRHLGISSNDINRKQTPSRFFIYRTFEPSEMRL